jgi:hypothetical protein
MKPRKTKPSAQEIANIAGVSLTLVNRKLAQGKSPRQIISEAEAQAQQAALKNPVNVTDLTGTNGHAGNGALTYSAAQASKESWLARLRELDYQERSRELIPITYVRIWASRFLVEGRDILLNAPGELADRLAAESDPRAVEEILRAWTDRIMTHFFELETLWGGGEPLDGKVLRERFDTARLAVVRDGNPRR